MKTGTARTETYARCRAVAPEAFAEDHLQNLVAGAWVAFGAARLHLSPLDGSRLAGPSQMSGLEERRVMVATAVDDLAEHRDLLALLQLWEIGKTWASAARRAGQQRGQLELPAQRAGAR